MRPARPLASVASGFRLPLDAARLLASERRLWGPAVVPFVLSLAAFAAAIALIVGNAGALYALTAGWLPVLEAERWFAWIWVGPARLLLAALGGLLFVIAAGACLVAAYLVASLLAAPFHDVLAARVERVVTGDLVDFAEPGAGGWVRDAARTLREELRRLAFFAAVVAPLVVVGVLVPGAQLVSGPAVLAFTVFFLPLDYTSYALDRRRIGFREKRRWMRSHAPAMAGFGVAAFLACAVPVLNLLAMPLLVVAGTLLVLRQGPEGPAQRGGAERSPIQGPEGPAQRGGAEQSSPESGAPPSAR